MTEILNVMHNYNAAWGDAWLLGWRNQHQKWGSYFG